MSHIYLDYNATTPLDPRVREAVLPFLTTHFGNPGSLHALGRTARAAIDRARAQVARAINAFPDEILFTSGATESNNLALRGLAHARRDRGRHLITSSIEHPSALNVCAALEREGFRVTYVPVDRDGVVDADAVERAVTDETILISLMAANNEVGTIQPVAEVGALARRRGIAFHVDAVQALGKLPVDVRAWQADLLTLSAHKIYGPKGVGVLYRRRGISLQPVLAGGHQEYDLRPGTEPAVLIVGCGAAVELAAQEQAQDMARLTALHDLLVQGLSQLEGCTLNGHPTQRLCTTVNVRFEGVDAQTLVMRLDLEGVAVSTGAACSSGRIEPSHVLLAMGHTTASAKSCVRFSLGRFTTEEDVRAALAIVGREVAKLRETNLSLKT